MLVESERTIYSVKHYSTIGQPKCCILKKRVGPPTLINRFIPKIKIYVIIMIEIQHKVGFLLEQFVASSLGIS